MDYKDPYMLDSLNCNQQNKTSKALRCNLVLQMYTLCNCTSVVSPSRFQINAEFMRENICFNFKIANWIRLICRRVRRGGGVDPPPLNSGFFHFFYYYFFFYNLFNIIIYNLFNLFFACQRGWWCTMFTPTPCLEDWPQNFETKKKKKTNKIMEPPPPISFFRPGAKPSPWKNPAYATANV